MHVFCKHIWNRYFELWKSLSGWRLFLFYTLHYTALFALLWPLLFFEFYAHGKSFIRYYDAMILWCNGLVHLSMNLQQAVTDFLAGNGWNFPPYNFSQGPIETDLRLELLQILSIFWPTDKIDTLYDILTVTRFYLTGLSFSIFGFYFRQKPMPVLIGAVSYIFCPYATNICLRYPFYMQAMIYLPLLIVCTEEVLRKHKPYLLSAIVFLTLSSDVYFACMLAIITALYAFVRFPYLYKENRLRNFASVFIRLIVSVGIGVLLSGVFLVPPLLQNFRTERIGNEILLDHTNLFYYTKAYYIKFISRFIVTSPLGYGGCAGFSVLAVPAIAVLFFIRKKEHGTLRIMFVILTLMLMFPIVAYVMSGFNAIYNRWSFAYAFCVCDIIMFELPYIAKGGKYTLICVSASAIIYSFVCYFLIAPNRYGEEGIGIVLLLASVGLILLCLYTGDKGRSIILPMCLVITCFSVYYSTNFVKANFTPTFTFCDNGKYYDVLFLNSPYGSFAKSTLKEKDKSFYRVAHNNREKLFLNSAFYFGVNGTTGEGEYYSHTYDKWIKELEVIRQGWMDWFMLDGRAALLALDAVKYYVLRNGDPDILPFGFTKADEVKNGNKTDRIFKNTFALPFGYTYDKFYSQKEYEALNAVNKQELQLQAAVLGRKPSSSNIKKAEPNFTGIQVPVSIVKADGVTWKNKVLKVNKANASLTLAFEGLKDAETYVRVVGLDVINPVWPPLYVRLKTGNVSSVSACFISDVNIYTNGMKTQLMSLGYTKGSYSTCTLTFSLKGTFRLDDLQIWCQPMEHFGTQIEALKTESLENVKTNPRGLTGTISLSKDKILCVSLPYADGWTAYVDGKKAEIMQVNTAFMGLELTAGKHTIEFKYHWPGTTAGMILSILGVFSLVGVILYYKRKASKGCIV